MEIIALLLVGWNKGKICDHARFNNLCSATLLLNWEMDNFPGNKHEALAFNTSISKALPSLKGGKIAWEYLATRYPTCVTNHSNAAYDSLVAFSGSISHEPGSGASFN